MLVRSLFLAALAASLPFCDASAQTATPKRGGTLVLTIGTDPSTLNRSIGSSNADGHIACVVYQGLMRMDAKGDPQPLLAKSYTVSPDGLTYSFDLVQTNWEDGKPMTSADVKYSLLEVSSKYSSVFAGAGRVIETIDTPAPDKVIIHLKEPYGPFLISLACQQGGSVLPKHVYEGTNPLTNPATLEKPIGLGPFLLKEWKRGDHLTLVKNPNYWEKGKPYLDEIIAKVIPQSTARTQALVAGEVDFVTNYFLPVSDYNVVKSNQKLALVASSTPPSVDFMFLNVNRKPLDNKKVRQALFIAMDRDYIAKTAYQGVGGAGTMPFTNRLAWSANPDIDYRKMYAYDPKRANEMLDEAGMKRGANGIRFKLGILIAADDVDSPVAAQAIKKMWGDVGVDLSIESVDRTTATKRMYTDMDIDTFINSYTSFSDPALGMARTWVTSSIKKAFGNGSGYSNPEVDKLFEDAQKAVGKEARGAIYRKVQVILADDLPVYTLHEHEYYDGISKDVRGIDDEQFLITWRDAWLDR